jgi:carbamoyltransferase
MIILGLSYLSDAGACIIRNGKLISAINEERLNRIKLFYGIPEMSIKHVLKASKLKVSDVNLIVTQGFLAENEEGIEFIDHGLTLEKEKREKAFQSLLIKLTNSNLPKKLKDIKLSEIKERYEHENFIIHTRNINIIREFKKFKKPIKVVEHHISHAAAAYFLSGWNNCFILTADGWGEMESNIFCKGSDGIIEKLYYSHSFDSLGYFYGSITKALGFIPHRHEGKVLGLAACGKPNRKLSWMNDMIKYNSQRKCFEGGFDKGVYKAKFDNPKLEELIKSHSREDVAFAVQKTLEKVVTDYIKDIVPKGSKLSLAGGIFANVCLNQRILELDNIKKLFIYPQMGDGGLSVGGALYYYSRVKKLKPVSIGIPYFGPKFSNRNIEQEIKEFGFKFSYHKNNIEKLVAMLILKNEVVMRFVGKMEHGPRALGNRSILYLTNDKSVNDWLNKSLRRSEFMPFAPSTMIEHASKCYKNIRDNLDNGLHMTMTFYCTEWMKRVSPGVVHVDGTARPQLVSKRTNSSFYKILQYIYKKTGIPSLINTSFNMHEEPIVCSPKDALRAFSDSKLKYLAIEDYLVYRDKDDILFANNK